MSTATEQHARGARTATKPVIGAYLTDGKRLVQVIACHQHGWDVEDSAHPEIEMVVPFSEFTLGTWRRVIPLKDPDA